jgi:uncharacterized protein
MYKESVYNIWADDILFNSLSKSLVKFQPDEVQTVKSFLKKTDEYSENNQEYVEMFLKAGFICAKDVDEFNFLKLMNKRSTFANKEYQLTINPTLQCNYRCWYCCVEEQQTKYENRRMDDSTVEKVKKLIHNLIVEDNIQKLHLDWFGGEPLMYYKEVVFPISQYAHELCVKYRIPFFNHATTNAYYINESMIESFKLIQLNSFQIPIDGKENKHNYVKNMNGVGHFRQIIQSINNLCHIMPDCHVVLRINYDETTLDSIDEIIPLISQDIRDRIYVDFQRVWQISIQKDNTGNNPTLLRVKNIFEKEGFNTLYFAYNSKQFRCCYADSFYHWVINYDGNVFKCSARNYDSSLIAASINENGYMEYKPIVYDYFSDTTFNNDQCAKCKLLPVCFGPCVQKRFENVYQGKPFQCLHDKSEISITQFIKDLYEQRH